MSEKTVNIYCAHPTGKESIPTVTIQIYEPVPSDNVPGPNWEKELRVMYTKEGHALADALCFSLPGGTIDALLIELLEPKRTLFRVPFYNKRRLKKCRKNSKSKSSLK